MYFLFLDESGNPWLDNAKIREQSNYFLLGGLIIKEEHFTKVDLEFKQFKKDNFPKELINLPIHAVDLNQVSRSKDNIYKPYLTDVQGKELLKKSYDFIAKLPIETIAIIIDNHNLKLKYLYPVNPYDFAYKLILEKFQLIISKRNDPNNKLGLINLAHYSNRITVNLTKIHNEILHNGTDYVSDYSNIYYKLQVLGLVLYFFSVNSNPGMIGGNSFQKMCSGTQKIWN